MLRLGYHRSSLLLFRQKKRRLFLSSETTLRFSSFSTKANDEASSSTSSTSSSDGSSTPSRLFSKVLIANRGEIACRIIRTCRRLGIPTVAVYSAADGPHALHARLADEAYPIGTGPTPAESYLLQDELLELAHRCQATAIHPGYGFLSENATFCNAVSSNNIKFVGPPASAMTAMGSKSQSKAIMEAAGVPTTPGYYDNSDTDTDTKNQDADFLYERAVQDVGFPLLIKAVSGGGGKGMRLVWKSSKDEFYDKLQACQNESQAAFGDRRVLLEKYLVRPRHIEVQVVADEHGNVVHLYERDCSLQRRHQKIIEEAPASDLPPSLRTKLGEMGQRAARAVGYVNAGTVEFLLDTTQSSLDTKNPTDDFEFYFCEMNTRLQVEHPVTEAITGLDLVEWQLRIAAGEPLPILRQEDIACRGHAFEARVYAENPARHFLPATGTVWHHCPPTTTLLDDVDSSTVRTDTGLQSGQDVSVYYDPMIAKLIVHGANRETALQELIHALRNYQIAGVPTNIDFLIQCAQHPVFAKAGAVNTGFLDDYNDDVMMRLLEATTQSPPPLAQVAGALVVLLKLEHRITGVQEDSTSRTTSSTTKAPWSTQWGSWRMGGGKAQRTLHLQNGHSVLCTSNRDGSFDMELRHDNDDDDDKQQQQQQSFHVKGSLDANTGAMEMVVDSTQRIKLTAVFKEDYDKDGSMIQVRMWPHGRSEDYFWSIDAVNPMSPIATADHHHHGASVGGEGEVKSPMPGTIRRINFAVGDTVKAGDVVVVMEAMKMEHACSSPFSGVISELGCNAGDVVDDGAVLFVVKDTTDESQDAKSSAASE